MFAGNGTSIARKSFSNRNMGAGNTHPGAPVRDLASRIAHAGHLLTRRKFPVIFMHMRIVDAASLAKSLMSTKGLQAISPEITDYHWSIKMTPQACLPQPGG